MFLARSKKVQAHGWRVWLTLSILCLLLSACSGESESSEKGESPEKTASPAPTEPSAPSSATVDSTLRAVPVDAVTEAQPVEESSGPHSQAHYLDLPEFGRYAFITESTAPVSLQVVDRMAGPLPAGAQRRDHLLEAGRVKVVIARHS